MCTEIRPRAHTRSSPPRPLARPSDRWAAKTASSRRMASAAAEQGPPGAAWGRAPGSDQTAPVPQPAAPISSPRSLEGDFASAQELLRTSRTPRPPQGPLSAALPKATICVRTFACVDAPSLPRALTATSSPEQPLRRRRAPAGRSSGAPAGRRTPAPLTLAPPAPAPGPLGSMRQLHPERSPCVGAARTGLGLCPAAVPHPLRNPWTPTHSGKLAFTLTHNVLSVSSDVRATPRL